MRDFEKRLRRLEKRMARLDVPSLDEVGAAFIRAAERAKSRFRGEDPVAFEEQRHRDHDTVVRWQRATGVDLEGEAQRAKQKLRDVGRRIT